MPNRIQKLTAKLLAEKTKEPPAVFLPIVKAVLKKRRAILALAQKRQTPFYLFDQKNLDSAIADFKNAFTEFLPAGQIFYAVKANYHPLILKTAVKNGFGLDVSSGRELELALKAKAKKIIFSGPGKTETELKLALKYQNLVTINLDNLSELKRLARLAKKPVNCGVRVSTKYHGQWHKFGINLTDLKRFFGQAAKYKNINLSGLQCHLSFNESEKPYINIIKEIAAYLKNNFESKELRQIKFFDFGGGFYPYQTDGVYPWDSPAGQITKIVCDHYGQELKFKAKYYFEPAVKLKQYAQGIGSAIDKYLKPIIQCQYYTEPGRIIANPAMHLVMKVMDIKKPDLIIVDAGINMVGWEKFEFNYNPIINLSHPALKEIKCQIFGSLCLPTDFWGHYCFARHLMEGDVLIIPNQGAYTYTWAQNFIKPIPPVVKT